MYLYASWLNAIKHSWESKDYDTLSTLFADQVTYFESPFIPPLLTKQQIVDQWKKDLVSQQDIKFEYRILGENEKSCIVHWNASFLREGNTFVLDGIFHIALNPDGKCTYFKQWWVVK